MFQHVLDSRSFRMTSGIGTRLAHPCSRCDVRQLTTLAVLLAAVVMGAGIAEAQTEAVDFLRFAPKSDPDLDSSFVYGGRSIVLLRSTGESYTAPRGAGIISEVTFSLYEAVTIDVSFQGIDLGLHGELAHGPAIPITIGLFQTAAPLPAGTQLGPAYADTRQACVNDDDQVVSCGSAEASGSLWQTTMDIVPHGNSSPMLFTSNVTLTGDALGVITGQQDADGFAEAVLTSKGQKPTFTTPLTVQWLEPAYRIVDITAATARRVSATC